MTSPSHSPVWLFLHFGRQQEGEPRHTGLGTPQSGTVGIGRDHGQDLGRAVHPPELLVESVSRLATVLERERPPRLESTD